jgi:hypothetical protein
VAEVKQQGAALEPEDAGRDPDHQPAGVHRAEQQRWGGFRPGADYLR